MSTQLVYINITHPSCTSPMR